MYLVFELVICPVVQQIAQRYERRLEHIQQRIVSEVC